MDKLVSIIVPVYNVAPYLKKCISSILEQSYKRIELILVDDGSTDGSQSICDEYAKTDSRVVSLHKSNGGQASARNMGLDVAKGDYISFVDSDDWIHENMIEKLIDVAYSTNADIVSCGAFFVFPDEIVPKSKNTGIVSECSKEYVLMNFFDDSGIIRSEVWNKLYKKEIIGNTRFKVGQIYEEVYFDRITYGRLGAFYSLDVPLYYYRINRQGSTNTFFKSNRFSFFKEIDDYIVELDQRDNHEIAQYYKKIAAKTAIDFYIVAKKMHVSEDLISKCKENFFLFYSPNNAYMKSYKFKLFACSSELYYILSRIRHYISK